MIFSEAPRRSFPKRTLPKEAHRWGSELRTPGQEQRRGRRRRRGQHQQQQQAAALPNLVTYPRFSLLTAAAAAVPAAAAALEGQTHNLCHDRRRRRSMSRCNTSNKALRFPCLDHLRRRLRKQTAATAVAKVRALTPQRSLLRPRVAVLSVQAVATPAQAPTLKATAAATAVAARFALAWQQQAQRHLRHPIVLSRRLLLPQRQSISPLRSNDNNNNNCSRSKNSSSGMRCKPRSCGW